MVENDTSSVEYQLSTSTGPFSIPFYFIENGHIVAELYTQNGDDFNKTTLTIDVDYYLNGAGDKNGGQLTLLSAHSGATLLIYRDPDATQLTSYLATGKFPATSHERALDKLTMLIQKFGWWWDSLSLKKPNIFANYYDALNNRIRNLRDPSQAQDAATKNYADTLYEQAITHSDNNLRKTLRVPEASVDMLPGISGRKKKILAFNDSGNPIAVLPESGSAADVLINLGSSEEGQGAWLVAYVASESAASRSVASRLRDYVSLHDYWFPDDGDDYYPALNKAMSDSPNVLIPPTGKHYIKTTAALISGARLIGLGPNSILSSPDAVSASGSEMITVLSTNGAADIALQDLVIEGGCNNNVTSKRAVRAVRFISCSDIRIINCEVNRAGDWALSFESSDRLTVTTYKHRGTLVDNLNGGRDGLHFLDCRDVSAADLDIISGDDMVGCTSENRDQRNISIKGVRGYSAIGSAVIANEEGTTTNSTVNILIEDVKINYGYNVRNVVRVQSINGANVTGIIIRGIRGEGRNHGIQVTSAAIMTNVDISDVNVTSVNQHGVYLNRINNLRASGRASAQNSSFDGWNIASCNYFDAQPAALSSPGWGVQVLNSAYFTMNGNCYNNGAGLFTAASGGNGRINGCSNYNATGVYAGGSTTSYYGLFNDETPTGRVDPSTVCAGYIARNRPRNLNALRDAYAACSFGQTVSGSISSQGAINCSVELVSDGRYKINFTTPFESTFYRPEIVAQIMNQDLVVRPIAKDVNYFTFEVRDSSGPVMANFILCEFKKAV